MSIRAIGVTEYGGPEVLHEVQLADRTVGPGEVAVRVHAAGVAPVDAMMRSGLLAGMYEGVTPPYVPGMEVSGSVVELGDEVNRTRGFGVGDDVVGFVDFSGSHGGYSEVVVLPAASVTAKPEQLTHPEAASFLNNSLTARNALDALALPAGATLLVTGAAGVVGGYVTQLASAAGLVVVAVASPGDEDLTRSFGAALFVARGDDLAVRVRDQVPAGVDAALDAAVLADAVVPTVRDGGRIGALRGWSGSTTRGITVHQLNVRSRAADTAAIDQLRDAAAAGELAIRIADVLPADQAAAAHRRLDAGGLRGRLVLDFTD